MLLWLFFYRRLTLLLFLCHPIVLWLFFYCRSLSIIIFACCSLEPDTRSHLLVQWATKVEGTKTQINKLIHIRKLDTCGTHLSPPSKACSGLDSYTYPLHLPHPLTHSSRSPTSRARPLHQRHPVAHLTHHSHLAHLTHITLLRPPSAHPCHHLAHLTNFTRLTHFAHLNHFTHTSPTSPNLTHLAHCNFTGVGALAKQLIRNTIAALQSKARSTVLNF